MKSIFETKVIELLESELRWFDFDYICEFKKRICKIWITKKGCLTNIIIKTNKFNNLFIKLDGCYICIKYNHPSVRFLWMAISPDMWCEFDGECAKDWSDFHPVCDMNEIDKCEAGKMEN